MFKLVVVLALTPFILGAPHPNVAKPYIPGGRIVGGQDADIADYPYQLSIVYIGFGHFCGASLLSPTWAVTAAHCTDGLDPVEIIVRAGSSNFTAGGQTVNVAKIIQHDNFDYGTGEFDISLLQFSSAVTIKNSGSISLPSSRPAADQMATVTGWGRISEDDESQGSEILQVVDVPIVSQEDCQAAFSVDKITDTMICAGYLGVGGKDACIGDSGGPLVVDGVLGGIVSWGIGCAEPDYPGVYTSVFEYKEWILQNVDEEL